MKIYKTALLSVIRHGPVEYINSEYSACRCTNMVKNYLVLAITWIAITDFSTSEPISKTGTFVPTTLSSVFVITSCFWKDFRNIPCVYAQIRKKTTLFWQSLELQLQISVHLIPSAKHGHLFLRHLALFLQSHPVSGRISWNTKDLGHFWFSIIYEYWVTFDWVVT